MAKILFYITVFLLLQSDLFAQEVFNRQYYDTILNSQNDFQRCNGVLQTSDEGYLVCGVGFGAKKMSAIKLNMFGDTIWSFKLYVGNTVTGYLYSAIETSDSNYLVCGVFGDPVLLNAHAELIKLDKNTGDTLWLRKIGLPNLTEKFNTIKETSDKGFIASGLRYNVNNSTTITDSDVYLVKTDSSGVVEWEQTFGGLGYEWGQSVEIADDGSFMVFGSTNSYGAGSLTLT